MSYYYHKINSVQDEANLLKQIINLETQVRAKRERERLTSNSESEKYAKIFEPITQSMRTLHTIASSSSSSSSSPRTGGQQSVNSGSTVKSAEKKEEEEEEGEEGEENDHYDHSKEDSISKEDDNDNESPLLHQALSQVSKTQRDDGVYGINWAKRTIGGKDFTVKNGNILQVQVGRGEQMEFKITDINVWKLLLYQNPYSKVSTETSAGEPTQAVQQYQEIADALNLIDYAKQHLKSGDAYKKRKKYKLLSVKEQQGSGFLFSIQMPSSFSNRKVKKKRGAGIARVKKHQYNRKQLFKPSTIVIPSDKKGLLSALVKATAEMKAGNSSMRNLVVPLEQEAKRRGILPIEYENGIRSRSNGNEQEEEDNLNWIYA